MPESENGQIDAIIEHMTRAGGGMAQRFFELVGAQTAGAAEPLFATPLPLPDPSTLAALQKDFAKRHASLWSSMLKHSNGDPVTPIVAAEPGDRRFKAAAWSESPVFDYIRQAYLLNAAFLREVTEALPIEDERLKGRARYLTRQYLDALAPSNFAASNPEFIQTALETRGESIARGIGNLLADLEKGRISMTDDSAFEVGRNLAVTPGAVIYENELMQLIQYAPLTDRVASRPLLIVPPCINKYYIMDLSPDNSLVRFIVEQGVTVFMISWKNAGPDEAHFGWDDYVEMGPLTALDVVRKITGTTRPNVLGFCVGGTILASALAVASARGARPVESVTFMTTLLDFTEAGELGCLIDEATLAAREAAIGEGGLMKGQELANVFASLRANDLIWQYVVGNYLKGGRPSAFDLLYWNADSTNLPGPFLTWYLRNMYLENNLRVPNRLRICGTAVDLSKLRAPAYFFAAAEDHIVPWNGAYMGRELLGGETTFVLGASGHIAGAINPASKNRRSYRVGESDAADPQTWLETTEERQGSWWLHWIGWLDRFGGRKVAAPSGPGNDEFRPVEPAPGRYVKQKA